jgi:hypothetical protein
MEGKLLEIKAAVQLHLSALPESFSFPEERFGVLKKVV